MGLRKRYKAHSYAETINDTALTTARSSPEGSPAQCFYIGIYVAASEALGTTEQPSDRQAWFDSLPPLTGYGWMWSNLLLNKIAEVGIPDQPFALPNLPTETELAIWGRPRTYMTVWKESLSGLENAYDAMSQDAEPDEETSLALCEQLRAARFGFLHLAELADDSNEEEDTEVHIFLADTCSALETALESRNRDAVIAASDKARAGSYSRTRVEGFRITPEPKPGWRNPFRARAWR